MYPNCMFELYLNYFNITLAFFDWPFLLILALAIYLISYQMNRRKAVQKKLVRPKSIFYSYLISKGMTVLNYLTPALFFLISYLILKNSTLFSFSEYGIIIEVVVSTIYGKFFGIKVLKIIKIHFATGFEIAVFRRFKKSTEFRHQVLPTVGAYGQLNLINDYTYLSSKVVGDEEDATNVFSEYYTHEFSTMEEWQDTAIKFIENSGLLVFYFEEIPTENMVWELNKAIELGKKERSIVIIADPIFDEIMTTSHLAEINTDQVIRHQAITFVTEFYRRVKLIYK